MIVRLNEGKVVADAAGQTMPVSATVRPHTQLVY